MNSLKTLGALLVVALLGSCSVTRHIPEGEALLVGNELHVTTDTLQSHKPHGSLSAEMESMLRPLPNATLLGFPYKVWLYYALGEPRKEKGFKNWFRKKLGEPPVLISSRALTVNSQSLESYLHNEGYFRSEVSGRLGEEKKRTVKAHYEAYVRPRYTIETTTFRDYPLRPGFNEFFKEAAARTNLGQGSPYRLAVIEEERVRIDQFLKTKGYYYFSPEHLIARVDTALGNHTLKLSMELKPTVPQTALKQYYIQDVHIYTDYKGVESDTMSNPVLLKKGNQLFDPEHRFRPRVFEEVIGFHPGSLYNIQVQDITLSRIINLKNFKFVKNKFELIPRSDSALLDVYYHLSPLKKKSMRAELSGLTKSNNLGGIQAIISWNNRNLFKGAEHFRISVDGGLDWQLGGGKAVTGTNFFRYKIESELAFPRFVVPFWKHTPETDQSLPRTSLLIGYENLVQAGLYTLNSIRGQWGYSWQFKKTTQHAFSPFGINIVRPRNISEAFTEMIFDSPNPYDWDRYFRILENRLLLESQYTIAYNPFPSAYSRHQLMMSGGINLVGNLAGLFIKKRTEDGPVKELFDIPYEQFVRFDGEFRHYYTLSPGLRLASRVLAGFGLPYGNSLSLPQFKQYFSGGSTGIRAFQARTLGPGGYQADSTTRAIFRNTQFGDIKLEFNTELRMKWTSLIHGALFVDAGNVWNYRMLDEYGPNSVFGGEFYKQIAVGGGVGLRFDFSYLVFRLDLATPFRKPWYAYEEEPRNPWVFREINFGNKLWRRENLVLNIAVAYPF